MRITETKMPEASLKNPVDLNKHLPSLLSLLGNKFALHSTRVGARPMELDLREWRIILVLGARGLSTVNEIADSIFMDQGGTSRTIGRLEARGLVSREGDKEDRRRSFIDLTAQGILAHNKIADFAHEREQRLLAHLSEEDRETLNQTLLSLIDQMNLLLARG